MQRPQGRPLSWGFRHVLCSFYNHWRSMDAICAIPLFGSRVAPRCMYASTMLVAGASGGEITFKRVVSFEDLDEYRWLEQLLDLEVDVIVCGGISPEIVKLLTHYGIQVICNVAGEAEDVLSALARGELHPWFGYYSKEKAELKRGEPGAGEEMVQGPVVSGKQACDARHTCGKWMDMKEFLAGNGQSAGSPMLAFDSLSYMGELGEMEKLFREKGYHKVGLIYCADFSRFVPGVAEGLGRFAQVYPLVCPAKCAGKSPEDEEVHDLPCAPAIQARIINEEKCDFVVVMGHCQVFYSVFSGSSRAQSAVMVPRIVAKREQVTSSGVGS